VMVLHADTGVRRYLKFYVRADNKLGAVYADSRKDATCVLGCADEAIEALIRSIAHAGSINLTNMHFGKQPDGTLSVSAFSVSLEEYGQDDFDHVVKKPVAKKTLKSPVFAKKQPQQPQTVRMRGDEEQAELPFGPTPKKKIAFTRLRE
jgi:hypothetical protein